MLQFNFITLISLYVNVNCINAVYYEMAKWSEWGDCNGARQRRTRLVTKPGNLMKPKTEEFQECSTSILPGLYIQAIIQYKNIMNI